MQFDWSGVANNPPSIAVRYLEEASICLESGAFRMSVVASACALNFGLDFVLRRRGLVNRKRVLELDKIIKKIRQYVSAHPNTVLSEIPLDKCEKVRYSRNAFAHPEFYLVLKPASRWNVYTLKPKFPVEKDKEEAYIASQYDEKKKLKAIAEESLETAYNSIREALEKLMLP
jgi:HEPN domain-containing protein